jgi:hypothetical protein
MLPPAAFEPPIPSSLILPLSQASSLLASVLTDAVPAAVGFGSTSSAYYLFYCFWFH